MILRWNPGETLGYWHPKRGIPDRAELESALGLVDYKKVDLGGDTREYF